MKTKRSLAKDLLVFMSKRHILEVETIVVSVTTDATFIHIDDVNAIVSIKAVKA